MTTSTSDVAEYNSIASKLLKDMGVQDTDALDFFQTKPNSLEWKSSIKAPSPPKARRTASSGTTHPRQNPREMHRPNGTNPQRRHSGEKVRVLRAPVQYHSTATANTGASAQSNNKQTGGPDGRFGYGSSNTTGNSVQQAPSVTSPTRRVIARPAPKPPIQATASLAKKSEYTVRTAPSLKHTSSAGAIVNDNHSSLNNKHPPSTIKGPTAKTRPVFESTDGNRVSKGSSPTKTKSKEQLRRTLSSPDSKNNAADTPSSKSTSEVVQTKPSSFQVLSTSSHRILHTSEDGASSKRIPSLKTGYYSEAHSIPVATRQQPVKAVHPVRSLTLHTTSTRPKDPQPTSSDANSSGVYDTLSPPMSPVEQPQTVDKTLQGRKLSEVQSLSGAYDRLSPIELATIRKISEEENAKQAQETKQSQPVSRKESVTSTSSDSSQKDEKPRYKPASPTRKSNLPVASSKSTHSGIKQHMRRHSSEDKHLKSTVSSVSASVSAIPQQPVRASESKLERNIQSPSSSSTATLSSPEPLSDCQTPDSDERRARLDAMQWSKQSLDRNMNAVATSTVQALSTLIEVLTPDPASKLGGTQFRYDTATPPLNPNWYAETDDSDSSSYPLSPLTSSSDATTSPRVKSPLTTSVSDSSISTATSKSEGRIVQKVRFADNPVEILDTKVPSKTRSVSMKQNGIKEPSTDHEKRRKMSDNSTNGKKRRVSGNKSSSPPQSKAKEQPASSKQEEQSLVPRESSSVISAERRLISDSSSPKSEKAITSNGDAPAVKENGVMTDMNSSIHDYAVIDVIDPQFHDYAILDPEYHTEFFGYCQRCTKPVIGADNGCFALDCVYHLKCFTCSKCSAPLSGQNFYTAGDQVLCEADYWSILETCHLCSLRIRDRVLRALDQSYHPDCFRCSVCSECLDGVPYISDASRNVYCIPDYHKKYAPKCAVCHEPIMPQQGKSKSLRVRSKDKSYHIHCYKCEMCDKQLASKTGSGEKCYPVGDHLFCKLCHLNFTQSEGQVITSLGPNRVEIIL